MTRIILVALGLVAILLMTTAVLAQSVDKLTITKSAVQKTVRGRSMASYRFFLRHSR